MVRDRAELMTHESCCEECAVARGHLLAESTVEAARARLKKYELIHAAIQYRASRGDKETEHHWAWEMYEYSGAKDLTTEQEAAIVNRYFADLIVNAAAAMDNHDG
jgi:hypothetical protein